MVIGNELLQQKQEALSARQAVENRKNRGAGWFILSWALGLIMIVVGGVAILPASVAMSMGKIPQTGFGSLALGGSGLVMIALSVFLLVLPSMIQKHDKELKRLNEAEPVATQSYFKALMAEAATYGIDTETRSDRTNFMDSNYEFTTLRNGETVDVTVREFNDEIVFMLNGERMRKPVTV